MADTGPDARRRQALVSDAAVKKKTEADLHSTRQKTERLKAQRLAKEASEGLTELDRKPAKAKRKGK
jgi:hypothetical protein